MKILEGGKRHAKNEYEITIKFRAYGSPDVKKTEVYQMLKDIKKSAEPGHTFGVVVDKGTYYDMDGDGCFRIHSIDGKFIKESD